VLVERSAAAAETVSVEEGASLLEVVERLASAADLRVEKCCALLLSREGWARAEVSGLERCRPLVSLVCKGKLQPLLRSAAAQAGLELRVDDEDLRKALATAAAPSGTLTEVPLAEALALLLGPGRRARREGRALIVERAK